MSEAEKSDEELQALKAEFQRLRLLTERAAYAYFCACPIGAERVRAHDIYSNILYATRAG
ncbi:hypothetical protein [Collimonas humicola]|uniref:hypothetical protein n=1 Tax=Collimonas humicola TaxID=2825886 RepID=UPI001B8D50AA|nr:hypothetical protein [Collimonas humicola]